MPTLPALSKNSQPQQLGSSSAVGGPNAGGSNPSPSPSGGLVHPHPYRHPLLPGNYEDDFPLRKTGEVLALNLTV